MTRIHPAAANESTTRGPAWRVPALVLGVLALLSGPRPVEAAQAPVIDSLSAASASVAPGEVVRVTVAAHDPDCGGECTSGCGQTIRPDLTVWTPAAGSIVTRDDGIRASPYTAWIEWEAPPEEGPVTIGVSLSDSGSFMCGGRLSTAGDVVVNVTTTPNEPPVVTAVTAEPARLHPGETSLITCMASDPDEGDVLALMWTADQGSIAPTGPATALFTADLPGAATVTCTATDSGGAVASGTVAVAVTDAFAEAAFGEGLGTPARIAVDSRGDVYVADASARGLAVVNLATGRLVYRLPLADVDAVAVDWQDRLLVGGPLGAWVLERSGAPVLLLDPGASLGAVVAVAADPLRERYAVLYAAGQAVLYDPAGAVVARFGSAGDGPAQLKGPRGVAITPEGRVVVADSGHALVKIFSPDGSLFSSFGGPGGAPGEFVQLEDVAVDGRGVVFASDTYQSWVQSFHQDGSLREVLGTYGDEVGEFQTPTGLAVARDLGRLVVASSNSSSLHVFALQGAAPILHLPRPVLSAVSVAFPPQPIGTTSEPLTVRLGNEGLAPLGIRNVSLTGRFRHTEDCPAFLDPGRVCSLSVRYLPEQPGTDRGALIIETSASSSLQVVRLEGEGFVPADLEITPSRLDFPDEAVGSTSEPLPLTLQNSGSVPLRIASVTTTGPYGVAGTCGVLEGGGACTLDVYFSPETAGDSLPGELTIDSDAASGQHRVPLDGRGVRLDLGVEPSRIDFGYETPGDAGPPVEILLSNAGEDFLYLDRLAIEGAQPAAFAIASDPCSGVRLDPGEACALTARFEPSEPDLRYAAELKVWSRASGSPHAVSFAGSTVSQGRLLFSDDFETGDLSAWTTFSALPEVELVLGSGETADLSFPSVPVGGATAVNLVIVNATAQVQGLVRVVLWDAAAGAFQASEVCDAVQLAPGERCELPVAFTPLRPGRTRGQLAVEAADGVALVGLIGDGLADATLRGRSR